MVKILLEHGASQSYHEAVSKKELSISKQSTSRKSTLADDDSIQEDDEEYLDDKDMKNTPLLWAAFKGNLRIVLMLLEDGYSPNDIDELGNNAVHLAAACGHKRVLQCLIDDGGSANAVNIYKNQPIDTSTIPEIREILEVAMEKGASMTKADIAAKHQQQIKAYTRMVGDFEAAISEAKNFECLGVAVQNADSIPQITTMLANALQQARERDLDEDLVVEGERLLLKLEVTHELHTDITNLEKQFPVRNQNQYMEYVHLLEATILRAGLVNVDPGRLELARTLIARAHIEYWVSVRIERLRSVHRASDADEHDMNCLRKTLEKASGLEASEEVMEVGSALLRRLDCELEIHRALATVPTYRLPPLEHDLVEGYWQEEDLGLIQQFEGFPVLPPEVTEYTWEHSSAYLAVETCIDRLRRCLVTEHGVPASRSVSRIGSRPATAPATADATPVSVPESNIFGVELAVDPACVSEAKHKLAQLEKDMKVLEAKDAADKQTAVDAAIKAAKKLKKGKKKGSPKKK